jgi:hypothetical protein
MKSARHLHLYSQGLETIQRRKALASQFETLKLKDELRDCVFRPSVNPSSSFNIAPVKPPKLYKKYVNRLRKATSTREAINQMLLPRQPLTNPGTYKASNTPRKNLHNAIDVEVTKDGPGEGIIVVGRLTLDKKSDVSLLALSFGGAHGLTESQTDRLNQQLEHALKTHLKN